jgi:hypothetical protein
MANLTDSIDQLTESLQQLAKTKTYGHASPCEAVAGEVPANELKVSEEVERFVASTRAYSDKTRNVSVGTY